MPEGDTIAYAAHRMRPVLEGHVPDAIRTPHPRHAMDGWPERLETSSNLPFTLRTSKSCSR